jgi:hypothetical protein
MRFLIDRCAGRLLADWLRTQGHDVVESRELGQTLETGHYSTGRPKKQEFSLQLILILVN